MADSNVRPRASRDYGYEEFWQKRWAAAELFTAATRPGDPKYFIVELPPFANGRLHLGHVRNYTLGDVVARFRRAAGWRVHYTTGFDAFGLPIENAAREEGCSPADLVARNSAAMAVQLRRLGLSHDPTRVLSDHEPRYYRWVQWVFRALLVNNLAYRSKAPVNWCPQCATTLADNLVERDRCWRCESQIERVEMHRWFIRETSLVDGLVDNVDIEAWPDTIKRIHRDWIGLRRGTEFDARVDGRDAVVRVFLEDGRSWAQVSGVGVAGNHEVVANLGLSERIERGGAPVDTGHTVRNPLTGRALPLLAVDPSMVDETLSVLLFDGSTDLSHASHASAGRPSWRSRLRDWDIARPRAWGTPVPVVHCAVCGDVPVPEDALPVLLPDDIDLRQPGNPLERMEGFVATVCPRCTGPARRDTDTLEAYSSPWWYYLICQEPGSATPFAGKGVADWMPVDLMIGGIDQARTCFFHLRTMAEALTRLGIVNERAPVRGLIAVGMVKLDGRKMSKTAGNVVDPAALIARYGTDAVRLAMMSAAAPSQDVQWRDNIVANAAHLLGRLRRLVEAIGRCAPHQAETGHAAAPAGAAGRKVMQWIAAAEGRAAAAYERAAPHVAIQQIERLLDALSRKHAELAAEPAVAVEATRAVIFMLAPVAPHLAEELWQRCGGPDLVASSAWPAAREACAVSTRVAGKVRA